MNDLFTDTTKVFVAIYEHKHGTDVCVFRTAEGAATWKDSLADEYWEVEFPDDERPAENIGDVYFDLMAEYGEYFNVTEERIHE